MSDTPRYTDEKVIFRTGPSPSKVTPDPTPFGDIEREIRGKGLTAPRVTLADIEAEIASEHYFTADEGVTGAAWCSTELDQWDSLVQDRQEGAGPPSALKLLTFCVVVLRNGFTVTGESACASPENFNAETGRKIARQKAVEKVWPLLGFRLRDKLSHEP